MSAERVMLLIDADNVSIDIVEQAVAWVAKHFGGPHVRRAYCTAECAVKHQDAFKRLSIRPMVNLAAGKNSTDIALAVDAVDLALAERPQVIVIASSDSDFAPLVSKLREKGCRVVGIGQDGKTGDETRSVYDDYELLSHRKAAARSVPAKPPAPAKRGSRSGAAKTSARAAKAEAPPAAPAAPAPPEAVLRITAALPELAAGRALELQLAAERLREAGLLSKSGSSVKLFGRHPAFFELAPEGKPNKVRLLAETGA
jgi:predicted nucleic acid-binding protein